MSVAGVVAGRLSIETFGPVFATLGTVVLNSYDFPNVESAAVLEVVGTLNGQLGTIGGRAWVSAVGVGAFTGAAPNTIVVRVTDNAGPYTGTISLIRLIVVR